MVAGSLRGLRNPDKRDIGQLLFFDVASQWEAFSTAVFELEIKKLYHVHRKVASRMMSSVDEGAQVSGYAHPELIEKRAKAFLAKTSPWANLRTDLGQQTYDYLFSSYRIRNFIAHAGLGKGREDFRKVVTNAGVPTRQRKGLSAGRFLLEYSPRGTNTNWFSTLLSNYERVADYVLKKLG